MSIWNVVNYDEGRIRTDLEAIEEYDAYNRQLKFESDFDKQIKKFLDGTGPDPTA